MTNIVTVVQTRMGSTRLPGKIMMPVLEKPLIYRMMERLMSSRLIGTIVIATTEAPSDDLIEDLCRQYSWNCFRGNENDLLDRHYRAAQSYDAEVVLKIPSDCPLIDPSIIDKGITFYLNGDFDYVSNLHPASYPDGNDVEIMSFNALETSWKEANRALEREHTTPYIWENPTKFKIGNFTWESGLDYSMSHRFTIDYPEDYVFIVKIFEELYPKKSNFSLIDILGLLKEKPDIYNINKNYAGVNWYRNHLHELKTIDASKTKILL